MEEKTTIELVVLISELYKNGSYNGIVNRFPSQKINNELPEKSNFFINSEFRSNDFIL